MTTRVEQNKRGAHLRLLARFERPFERTLRRELNRHVTELIRTFKVHGEEILDLDMINLNQSLEQLLYRYFRRVGTAFKRFAFPEIEGVADDNFTSEMIRWSRERAAEAVVNISDGTRKRINLAIVESIEEGLSISQTSTKIRQRAGRNISKFRAQRIARTELHTASTQASQIAAEETSNVIGRELFKTWIAARDSRTRECHREADNQKVRISENFNVCGELIPRPGTGAPGNAINCRCVLSYTEN